MDKRFLTISVFIFIFLLACKKEPTAPPVKDTYNWPVSTPADQGISSDNLELAFTAAAELGFVDALVVIRNGYLVGEKYYNGYDKFTSHHVMSVSKSFLNALTGIALQQGIISNLDVKMMDYFAEYAYLITDERKFQVTLRHLLTMRMGIDIEENHLFQVLATDNWIRSTLELPLLSAPGEAFRYSTMQTHLLAAILTKTSGVSLLEFANKYLFEPMNINVDYWNRDPQGYYFGGSDMYFTPREMAVLGYLYLNNGKMNGIQIVPSSWVSASLTGTWPDNSPEWGVLKNYNYGYLWWLGYINDLPMFMALGHGGQTVVTFPDLNLIVVSTADYNVGWDENQIRPILKVISDYILPAVYAN